MGELHKAGFDSIQRNHKRKIQIDEMQKKHLIANVNQIIANNISAVNGRIENLDASWIKTERQMQTESILQT